MTTDELLDALLSRLSKPVFPVEIDLWDTAHVAAYLKRSHGTVRDRILVLSSFPRPIKLPPGDNPLPLYKAREVIEWAESYQVPEERTSVLSGQVIRSRRSRGT
jgi:hypothetical protein